LGDRRVYSILFGLVLLLVTPLAINSTVFADDDDDDDDDEKKLQVKDDDDDDDEKHTTKIIHLGFLQLAAHDFFNMNRCIAHDGSFPPFPLIPPCGDSENGKLDASTVLFNPKGGMCDFEKSLKKEDGCELYNGENGGDIAKGGEIRSSENIMILTAGALVGEKYLKLVDKYDGDKEKAYKKTLKYYHKQLKKAYEESFHLKFPKAKDGEVTNLHNLAVRAGHDFLPAEIWFNGKLTSLFDDKLDGKKLSKKEQKQQSSPVDGEFDEEFLHIKFCPAPGFCIDVDLLAADQSFGKQFAFDDGEKYDEYMDLGTFDEFMEELKDGKFNKKDKVSKLLKQVFSRGLYLE